MRDHCCRPEEHDESQPDRGTQDLHRNIRRYFCCDIEGEEDSEAVIVLQTVKLEILLKVVEAGIANVGPIEKTSIRSISLTIVASGRHDLTVGI